MKRWGLLVAAMYLVMLVLLAAPVLLICFADWGRFFEAVYEIWYVFVWAAVMVGCEALLLVVPIRVSQERPVSRRRLFIPVITSAFLLALLFGTAATSVLVAIFTEKVPAVFMWSVLGLLAANWFLWSWLFYRRTRNVDKRAAIEKMTPFLLKGSILELLVAVPTHVIVRARGDCCAPYLTFFGIATGIAVSLMSFGPAMYFLFADRAKRISPKRTPKPPSDENR